MPVMLEARTYVYVKLFIYPLLPPKEVEIGFSSRNIHRIVLRSEYHWDEQSNRCFEIFDLLSL